MNTAPHQPIRFSDEQWKREVKARLDLRELIEGIDRDGKVLCPWHTDSTPSLHVYADHVHCFACGTTQDVFGWLKQTRGLTFPEAKELAGELAGIGNATPPARSHSTPSRAASQNGRAATPATTPTALPPPRPLPAPTLAAFCEARALDLARLRDVWRVAEGAPFDRPALLYPVPAGPRRVKYLDGGKPKYRWERKGGKRQWYGLAQADALPAGPLYVVNGEPAVWAAQQAGVRAICVVAGEGSPPTPAQVEALRQAGYSAVRVVYDTDRAGAKGARKTVAALIAAGVDATAYQLPTSLGAHGDVDDLHQRVGAGLAAVLVALPELPTAAQDATPARSTEREGSADPDAAGVQIFAHPGYVMHEGRIDLIRERNNHRERAAFLPCCPVVREVIDIKGADPGQQLHYRVAVEGREGVISHGELPEYNGWEELRMPGIASRTTRALIADVVTQLAQDAPETPGVNVTGWHELDGQWRYVWLDGQAAPALPDERRVYVAGVPKDLLDTYAARVAVLDGQAAPALDDMKGALSFMAAVSPARGYGVLALGAAARAMLHGLTPSKTSMIFEGAPGYGKTGLTSLARGLVIPAYVGGHYEELPTATFKDTINTLEVKIAREASMPVQIDDVAIADNATPAEVREHQQKVDRYVRSAHDGSPIRDRMTRDMKQRASHYVRTLPFLTAQALPADSDVSMFGRTVLVQVGPGDINTFIMREHGPDYAAALLALGRHFIDYWARRVNAEGLRAIVAHLDARYTAHEGALADELAAALGQELPQNVDRLPRNGAYVLAGLDALAESLGLGADLIDEYRPLLVRVLVEQAQRIEKKGGDEGDGPFTTLMNVYRDNIARGVPMNGSRPHRVAQRAAQPGPEEQPTARYAGGEPWPPHAAGWRATQEDTAVITAALADQTANALYLTSAARKDLSKLAAQTPGCASLATSDGLARAAAKEGWFVRAGADGKHRMKIRHRGEHVHGVWAVRLDLFLGDDGQGGDSDGGDGSSGIDTAGGARDEMPQAGGQLL